MDIDFVVEIKRINLELMRLSKIRDCYQQLNDLATNSASAPVKKERKNSNLKWKITKKQLNFMYYKQNMSAEDIAEEACVSKWTVFNRLKAFEIPKKNKISKKTSTKKKA